MAYTEHVGFQADPTLIDRDLAMRAHSGTSWSPEKRGEMEIKSFVEDVEHVHKTLMRSTESAEEVEMVDKEMDKFQRGYAQKWNIRMAAHSSCFSSMIAGSSKFPARQAQRASNAYDKRSAETTEYKERAINAIIKKLKERRISAGGGEIGMMEKKLAAAEAKQVQMKAVNKILRNKKTSDDGKVQQLRDTFGMPEQLTHQLMNPDYGKPGYPPYELTNNNANIKRMKERVRVMTVREDTPSAEITFAGGTITDSNEEDRVQIYFDEMPDGEMRSKLKGAGWHWSPANGVWQRKRTAAAMESAKQIVRAGVSPLQQTAPTIAPEPAAKTVVKPAPDMPPILTAPPELAADVLGGGAKGMTQKELLARAEKLGRAGFLAGKQAPAQDAKILNLCYIDQIPHPLRMELMTAWSKGWQAEHQIKTDKELREKGIITPRMKATAKRKPAPTPSVPPILTAPPELAADVLGAGPTPTPTAKPVKQAKPTQAELTRARKLGKAGYWAGKQAPAQDAKILDMCRQRSHDAMMALMTAWTKGWHAEHQIEVDKALLGKGIIMPGMEAATPKARKPKKTIAKPAPTPSVPPALTAPPELAADVLGTGGMGLTPTPAAPKPKRKPAAKSKPAPDMPPILVAPPELAADVFGGGMMGLTPTQAAPRRKPAARTTRKQPKKTAAAKPRKTAKKAAKPKTKKTAATPKLTASQREYLAIQGFVMVKRGGKYVRITG